MTTNSNKNLSAGRQGAKLHLEAKNRDIFGKKLKKVRIIGKLPGNIFGPDFKSQAITVDVKDFKRIYHTAKETGVVYIKTDRKKIPVLIRNVQKHPVNNILLHVDFRKIDLSQKIETNVTKLCQNMAFPYICLACSDL